MFREERISQFYYVAHDVISLRVSRYVINHLVFRFDRNFQTEPQDS